MDGQVSGGYRDLQHGSAPCPEQPLLCRGGPGSSGGLTWSGTGPGDGAVPLMATNHAAYTSPDPEAPGPANATGEQKCLDVAFLTREEQGHRRQAGLPSPLAQAQIHPCRVVVGKLWVQSWVKRATATQV